MPVGSPPLLQGGDGIDGRAISHLLKVALGQKKEEEIERRREEREKAKKEEEEYEEWQVRLARATQLAQQLLDERSGPRGASSSSRPVRRKKKRQKKKAPRTSSSRSSFAHGI